MLLLTRECFAEPSVVVVIVVAVEALFVLAEPLVALASDVPPPIMVAALTLIARDVTSGEEAAESCSVFFELPELLFECERAIFCGSIELF